MSKHPDPPVISPGDEHRVTYRVGNSHVAMQFVPFLAIAIILLGFFLLPLVKEGVSNECSAIEVNALRVASQNFGTGRNQFTNALVAGFGDFLQQKSNGALASYIIKINYPNIPTTIGCAVSYYQLLFNPGDWRRFIAPLTPSSETQMRSNPNVVAHPLRAKKTKQRASTDAKLNDSNLIPPQSLSANDLAFGLDKLHWGMSIKDAKTLFPNLNGEPIQPLQVLATLSLDNYEYGECAFAVHLDFENAKLTRVELETDAVFAHPLTFDGSASSAKFKPTVDAAKYSARAGS
jgi:hypothetical protein